MDLGFLTLRFLQVDLTAKVSKTLGTVDTTGKFNLTVTFCLTWSMLQNPRVFTRKIGLGCF